MRKETEDKIWSAYNEYCPGADKGVIYTILGIITEIEEEYEEKLRGAIIWSVEDILQQAEEMHVQINDQDAEDILDNLINNHDCTIGITWETIEMYIDMHLISKK